MRKAIILLAAFLLPTGILFWFFVYREPCERMLRLLDGETDVTVNKVTVYTVHDRELMAITDSQSLEFLSNAFRTATNEGRVPNHRPRRHHYATVWLGTIHAAKIGIYADSNNKGFMIYYPYHEDSSIDIHYYWIPLDGPIPSSIENLYQQLSQIDNKAVP